MLRNPFRGLSYNLLRIFGTISLPAHQSSFEKAAEILGARKAKIRSQALQFIHQTEIPSSRSIKAKEKE
jgi:hypothetical protein